MPSPSAFCMCGVTPVYGHLVNNMCSIGRLLAISMRTYTHTHTHSPTHTRHTLHLSSPLLPLKQLSYSTASTTTHTCCSGTCRLSSKCSASSSILETNRPLKRANNKQTIKWGALNFMITSVYLFSMHQRRQLVSTAQPHACSVCDVTHCRSPAQDLPCIG